MSDAHVALGPGGEFDAIGRLLARWGPVARGVGDDAAVLEVPAGERLVVSTDTSVEDVHFRAAWLSPEEIGYRATAAALSDLAAMAATPLGLTVALVLPSAWRARLDALADGIAQAASAAGTPIVGGDLSGGAVLSLGVTVLGSAAHPLERGGARVGQTVWVTGQLGGPRAALQAWQGGTTPEAAHRERFARPVPRLAAARWLAARGATAAIDLSDGLLRDAGHIAAASGVTLVLALEQVPVLPGVSPRDAAASGEEYELLVAAPADLDAAAFARAHGVALTAVGTVQPAAGRGAVQATWQGRPVQGPTGFDHFGEGSA